MRRFYLLIFIIIAILIVGGVYYAIKNWQPLPGGEETVIVEDILSRKEVMADVSGKIAQISPVKPVLGGKWFVTRFWFIQESNKDFYVEYSAKGGPASGGEDLRRVLVEAEKKEGKLNYRIIAYFEPGQVDWTLKDGEDKFFGSLLDLYEYNEELEDWIKKN